MAQCTTSFRLEPWEISVFEPADFSHYAAGVREYGSASHDWLVGDGLALDPQHLPWPASHEPVPDSVFDLSQVLQNDFYDPLVTADSLSTSIGPAPLPSSCTDMFLSQLPETVASLSPSPNSLSPVSSSTPSNPRKRSPPVDPTTALKRQRNNVAAKKYRQKKVDRISELELELQGVKDERDDLKIRLARQEAETAALKTLLKMKASGDA